MWERRRRRLVSVKWVVALKLLAGKHDNRSAACGSDRNPAEVWRPRRAALNIYFHLRGRRRRRRRHAAGSSSPTQRGSGRGEEDECAGRDNEHSAPLKHHDDEEEEDGDDFTEQILIHTGRNFTLKERKTPETRVSSLPTSVWKYEMWIFTLTVNCCNCKPHICLFWKINQIILWGGVLLLYNILHKICN